MDLFANGVDISQYPPAVAKMSGGKFKYKLVYGFKRLDTLKALASFAIFSTSRKRITRAIIKQVKKIVFIGVKYLLWTFVNRLGNSLSFAIAKGNLEEANTPEFAIEISVRTPITEPRDWGILVFLMKWNRILSLFNFHQSSIL